MARDLELVIAGKVRKLRYRLPDRADIERVCNVARPNAGYLGEIVTSNQIFDQATIVWAGIKAADAGYKGTSRSVIEDFQRHNERGEGADYYQDVYCPAVIRLAESGLLGAKLNIEEFKRILNYVEPEGKENAADEGEGPVSVKARE